MGRRRDGESQLDEPQRKMLGILPTVWACSRQLPAQRELDKAIESFDRGSNTSRTSVSVGTSYSTVNAIIAPIEGKLRDAASQVEALARRRDH